MSCSTSPSWPTPANYLSPKSPAGAVLLELPVGPGDLYSVTIAARPADDLQFTDLTVVQNTARVIISGGIAGLVYALDVTVTLLNDLSDTVTWMLPVSSFIAPSTMSTCTAESTMYGSSQATWIAPPPVIEIATALIGTGNSQATAAYLPAYNNVILSSPAGTGFTLNPAATSPVAIQNLDSTNNSLIYPPANARINNLAVNQPIAISSNGGRLTFTTDSPLTQWYAG